MIRHCATLALLAVWLCATNGVQAEVASKEFLAKQLQIYDLLWHVNQPELDSELYEIGKKYNMSANIASYKNEEVVPHFEHIYNSGMLPRGAIFSEFYPHHLEQAIALFKVFYYSKDFKTLFKTAAWAKIHINEGMYLYALSVAVTHHPDTKKMRVAPVSEMYPYLYFDSSIIQQGLNAKVYYDPKKTHLSEEGAIVIYANHTSAPPKYTSYYENKLRYFYDDVAVNDFQYFAHIIQPYWLPAHEFGYKLENRGEIFLWQMRTQLARYQAERKANGLGHINDLDWSYPIAEGYIPGLNYHNGWPVPHRTRNAVIQRHHYKYLHILRGIEDRIAIAIDMGHAVTKNGTFYPIRNSGGVEVLGNIIEGNADSINLDVYGRYQHFAKTVLGFGPVPISKSSVFPSALQYDFTAQRDPIYWSLVKKMVSWYERFIGYLPPYTHEELDFPEIKVVSANVSDVSTFFEYVDHQISSGFNVHNASDKQPIYVRQPRLNHNEYNFRIEVESDKDVKAEFRLFFGPKEGYEPLENTFAERSKHFYLLDAFIFDLKAGSNKIKRSSTQAVGVDPSAQRTDTLYRKVEKALNGEGAYEYFDRPYAYPLEMLLPKGSPWSADRESPFEVFVYVSNVENQQFYPNSNPLFGGKQYINRPLGFPLDKPLFPNFEELSNVYFMDFNIHHKHGEVEFTHYW